MPTPTLVLDLAAVGALMRARTKDRFGNESGTFSADTRPTDDEVQALGARVSQTLLNEFSNCSSQITDGQLSDYTNALQEILNLRLAIMIELSYWPEQVATQRSPYQQYRDLLRDSVAAVRTAYCPNAAGSGGDGSATFVGMPAFLYDPPADPVIGNWGQTGDAYRKVW